MFHEVSRTIEFSFINFIGDGDSKAYYEVVKANPYGDRYPVNKCECLGHIQKRVGSRLRKLKKSMVIRNCRTGRHYVVV